MVASYKNYLQKYEVLLTGDLVPWKFRPEQGSNVKHVTYI